MKDTKQQWFKDAKYGLFIHWGLYSILAGEYRGETTPFLAEWILNTLDIPVEEYEKLASQFNPTQFDAEAYVKLAASWGMKYLTFTAKHHDGFAMFDSKADDFNIVKVSPYGKDIVKELAEACKKYQLKFCLYYSQAQDWHHPDGYRSYNDNSKKNFRRYLDNKCLPQLRELLSNYGDIGMIWFDTPMGITQSESQEIIDLVKSIQPQCLVSGRIGHYMGDYMTTADNMLPLLPYFGDWEVPGTLNTSWGYKKSDHAWKEAKLVADTLIRVVSKGGNYLLNIGPKANGEIPKESLDILDELGDMMSEIGESIYATKATPAYIYEQNQFVLTSKPGFLYIHMQKKPEESCVEIMNVGNTLLEAIYLNTGEKLAFNSRKALEGNSYWNISLPPFSGKLDHVVACRLAENEIKIEALA